LNWANHYSKLAIKRAKWLHESILSEPLTPTHTLDYIHYNNQTPAKPKRKENKKKTLDRQEE